MNLCFSRISWLTPDIDSVVSSTNMGTLDTATPGESSNQGSLARLHLRSLDVASKGSEISHREDLSEYLF